MPEGRINDVSLAEDSIFVAEENRAVEVDKRTPCDRLIVGRKLRQFIL
jgi:hypothetical protein